MLRKKNIELNKSLEKFHCGERFQQLAIIHKRESPTEWAKILGLSSRNQVYYRWQSEKIDSKELIMICDQFNISIGEFFEIENHATDLKQAPSKIYMEDRIDALEQKVMELEAEYKNKNAPQI